MYWGNSSNFFPKIFPEFFYEYFVKGIEPPYGLSKCHIWGGYGGGEGVISPMVGYAKDGEGSIKLSTDIVSYELLITLM